MGMLTTCDICKRTSLELAGDTDISHYKVKKENYNWYECSWDRIDICTDCEEVMRKVVERKKAIERKVPIEEPETVLPFNILKCPECVWYKNTALEEPCMKCFMLDGNPEFCPHPSAE